MENSNDIAAPTTANIVQAGYMMDAKGRLVPEHLVKPIDKQEDELVRSLIGHAETVSATLGRFKGHCFDDVGAHLSMVAEEYGVKKGGAKGNLTLTSYDGRLKVQLAIADQLSFGPELQVAKALVDECIRKWADGANDKIHMLVEHAFQTDKEGKVNREAIFALRRIDIDDAEWKMAMQAIADSIRVIGSKSYFRFYRRPTQDAPWELISVDLAAA